MPTSNNCRFNTLILDLDGPLLEGKLRHYQCYADILQEQGYQPVPINHYWDMKRKRLDRRVQLQQSDAESIYELFLREWLARIEQCSYLSLDSLQPQVIPILKAWQAQGLRLVLATLRNHPDNLYWQLEQLGLRPFFAEIIPVGSLEQTRTKATAVAAYLNGRSVRDCLWIGDTEIDVEAARSLGMAVATVSCGLRTEEYLSSLQPDFVCADLEAVVAIPALTGS